MILVYFSIIENECQEKIFLMFHPWETVSPFQGQSACRLHYPPPPLENVGLPPPDNNSKIIHFICTLQEDLVGVGPVISNNDSGQEVAVGGCAAPCCLITPPTASHYWYLYSLVRDGVRRAQCYKQLTDIWLLSNRQIRLIFILSR